VQILGHEAKVRAAETELRAKYRDVDAPAAPRTARVFTNVAKAQHCTRQMTN
jgi:hypothetical protein